MTLSQARPVKVLVVDDSLTVRMTVKDLLQDEDTNVLLAEDGRRGIELCRSESPDCILLAYEMPNMNGFEFLTEMRALANHLPPAVVMLTGKGAASVAVEAMKRGAQDYLVKADFTPEALRYAVRHAITRVRAEREIAQKSKQIERLAQELAEANIQLSQLSRLDSLTKLLNRRAFEESITLEHERSLRCDRVYSIIMIDIDHFKQFNDTQGHQAGDDCLQRVAACMAQTARGMDLVGRYGGEEFIILAPETTPEGARTLCERIRQAVCDLNIPHPASATAEQLTISVGVATGPAKRWEDMVKRADDALYAAKDGGRNRVCAHQAEPEVVTETCQAERA
ncbi:MAG: diguanylate cyclase [bacterium]|nr:diguanylate cyclase [bacterium]